MGLTIFTKGREINFCSQSPKMQDLCRGAQCAPARYPVSSVRNGRAMLAPTLDCAYVKAQRQKLISLTQTTLRFAGEPVHKLKKSYRFHRFHLN